MKSNKDLNELVAKSKFDINTPEAEEHICIYIQGEEKKICIGTFGNFSVISGKAKSRKTFVSSAIASCLLTNSTRINFTGSMTDEKYKILFIDTEQGIRDSKRVYKRIMQMSNLPDDQNPANFEYYRLRPYSPSERVEILQHIVSVTKNLAVVIIDGIKDLIQSINDEKEATACATLLMKLTENYNIHIITVIHHNKTDNFIRGHLGTELMNKAETVIDVEKNDSSKNISVIKPQMMRDMEFEPFSIFIDEKGFPQIQEHNYKEKAEDGTHISKLDRIKNIPIETQYSTILNPIFEKQDKLFYTLLRQKLFKQLKDSGQGMSDKYVAELLKHYVDNKIILKENNSYILNEQNVLQTEIDYTTN